MKMLDQNKCFDFEMLKFHRQIWWAVYCSVPRNAKLLVRFSTVTTIGLVSFELYNCVISVGRILSSEESSLMKEVPVEEGRRAKRERGDIGLTYGAARVRIRFEERFEFCQSFPN